MEFVSEADEDEAEMTMCPVTGARLFRLLHTCSTLVLSRIMLCDVLMATHNQYTTCTYIACSSRDTASS